VSHFLPTTLLTAVLMAQGVFCLSSTVKECIVLNNKSYGLALVRAMSTSYGLSIVTMYLFEAVWLQFLIERFSDKM